MSLLQPVRKEPKTPEGSTSFRVEAVEIWCLGNVIAALRQTHVQHNLIITSKTE